MFRSREIHPKPGRPRRKVASGSESHTGTRSPPTLLECANNAQNIKNQKDHANKATSRRVSSRERHPGTLGKTISLDRM